MEKYEMKVLLADAIHPAKLCRVFLTYDLTGIIFL